MESPYFILFRVYKTDPEKYGCLIHPGHCEKLTQVKPLISFPCLNMKMCAMSIYIEV